MNPKKIELLRNAPWDEIYVKLFAYAEFLIDRLSWNDNRLPKGYTPETIVQDVIAKTFSEDRNWDPDRGELFPWLKWVVKSEISHLVESASHRNETSIDQYEDELSLHRLERKTSQSIAYNPRDTNTEREEETRRNKERIDALLEACDGRPELEEIVYAICDDECSPKAQDLADHLQRPVKVIYQNLRALRRRADKIKEAERAKNGQQEPQ